MIRRPRSTLAPMALTFFLLAGLVAAFTRFDERVVVRFTRPAEAPTPPPTLRRGAACSVEGVADAGDAIYQSVQAVILELSAEDERFGKVLYGSTAARYDRYSKKFSGTIKIPKKLNLKQLTLEAVAIDNAGRHHHSGTGSRSRGGKIIVTLE
jgi:hypothetical protein